jgi:hypothetical protein
VLHNFDGYAVNTLCYFLLVLIVALNSSKTKEKFPYLTTELAAWLEENILLKLVNECC